MADHGTLLKRQDIDVTAQLRCANGRRRARLLTIDDVRDAVAQAERTLDRWHLPLALRKGTRVTLTSGDRVPNSYRGYPQETRAALVRRATGWVVSDVWEGYVPRSSYRRGPARDLVDWSVTSDAAAWLCRDALTSRRLTIRDEDE